MTWLFVQMLSLQLTPHCILSRYPLHFKWVWFSEYCLRHIAVIVVFQYLINYFNWWYETNTEICRLMQLKKSRQSCIRLVIFQFELSVNTMS